MFISTRKIGTIDVAEVSLLIVAGSGKPNGTAPKSENHAFPVPEGPNFFPLNVIFASGQRIGVEHLPKEMEVAGLPSVEVGQAVSLDKLEEQLLNRLPRAADLSPETFSEEIEDLNEVLG